MARRRSRCPRVGPAGPGSSLSTSTSITSGWTPGSPPGEPAWPEARFRFLNTMERSPGGRGGQADSLE